MEKFPSNLEKFPSNLETEVPKESSEVPKESREVPKQSEILDGVKIVEIILEDLQLCYTTFLHVGSKEACGVPVLAMNLDRMIKFENNEIGRNYRIEVEY